MSIYKYELANYRAVKSAEITVDGITVLAGENGSGKSTLSRFLYIIVKVLSEYEALIDNNARQELLMILGRMERANLILRNVASSISFAELQDCLQTWQLNDFIEKLLEVIDKFGAKINEELIASDDSEYLKARLITLFVLEKDTSLESVVGSIVKRLKESVIQIKEEAELKKTQRSAETFEELGSQISDNQDVGQVALGLQEDGVELLDLDHFNPLLNLRQVIYYKTYELMDYLDKRSEFHNYLVTPAMGKLSDEEKLVAKVLRDTLGGEVVLAEDDIMPIKQLHFKRKDGLDISLKQAATGLVSFSFLQRLLENGYFKEGTLLIIDEPEAHLHPKWIVEYARILVMIQKYLKVKIVLSTHNPDMLAAIDSIARRENVRDVTNFYFAKPDESDVFKYNYKKLDSIEEIFDSFNIALIKIEEYGKD